MEIGFTEGVDPVDQVDVQVSHIHSVPADALDEGGVRALVVALRSARRDLLRFLGEV
jgi:hypothetical protein